MKNSVCTQNCDANTTSPLARQTKNKPREKMFYFIKNVYIFLIMTNCWFLLLVLIFLS